MDMNPFHALVSLVEIDQELDRLALSQAVLEREKQATLQQARDLGARVEQQAHEVRQLHIKVRAAEVEYAQIERTIQQKKLTQQQSTNLRELDSLMHEIDFLQQGRDAQEEAILGMFNDVEHQESVLKQLKTQAEQSESSLVSVLKEFDAKLQLGVQQIQHKEQERVEVEPHVEAELYQKYVQLRQKIKNPVVPMENGLCSACFYMLGPAEIAMLHRHAQLQCRGCYRFLYKRD